MNPRDYNVAKLVGGKMVAAMMAANPGSRHSYGITYIVRLPNGNLKIGFTAKKDLVVGLVKRWQELSRKHGRTRVEPLCTMYGGQTLESLLHFQFQSYSVFDAFGEQYTPSQELIQFAVEKGHCNVGATAVGRYATYVPQV